MLQPGAVRPEQHHFQAGLPFPARVGIGSMEKDHQGMAAFQVGVKIPPFRLAAAGQRQVQPVIPRGERLDQRIPPAGSAPSFDDLHVGCLLNV